MHAGIEYGRRALGAALGAALLAASAQAHFLWVHVQPGARRVALQFGEDGATETAERLIERLSLLELADGAGAALEPRIEDGAVYASAPDARVAHTDWVYGLYGHAQPRYLLSYHAKGCASLAEAAAPLGEGAELLAERVADGLRLTALLGGEPVELSEVIVMTPDGVGTEVYDTDARGMVVVPAPAAGAFHARAEIEEERAGEYEGEPFGMVKHYATLTVAELAEPGAHARPTTAVEPLGLMPRAVTSFGAATLGGHVYVLGGYFGEPHDYHREGQSGELARMSLIDGSWEQLPSPGRMQSVAMVAYGEQLYRVGGMRAHNAPGEDEDLRSVDEVARYDPLAREWTELAPLPGPRSSHEAAVLDGHLYVAGGWRMSGAGGEAPEWQGDLLRLDLARPSGGWERIAAPFRRRALGVAAVAGRLVAVGGMTDGGEVSSAVDVYDPAAGAWSRGPDYPEPGFGLAARAVGGRVYASAGDGVVYTWAPGEQRWSAVTSWAFPRFFHQLVEGADGALLAFGGIARGGRVRHVERLLLEGGAPPARVTRWRLPAPAPLAGGEALFLSGNLLCAFGGERDGAPVRDARRFDLAALRFERCEPLPEPMAAAAGLADGGARGLALGGASGAARAVAGAFAYDLRYDLWDPADLELPAPLSGYGACRHGEELWLFGGVGADGAISRAVHRRPEGAAGFERVATELPRERQGFALAVHDGRAVLVGGYGADGSAVEPCDAYEFERGVWSELPGSDVPLHAPRLAACAGALYLCGTRSAGDAGGAVLLRYEPEEARWSELPVELALAPDAELALFAFGERLLLHAAAPGADEVELLLIDPGTTERVRRDVAGHFRR